MRYLIEICDVNRQVVMIVAATMLALLAAQASQAATIVVDGSTCTLAQAITAANTPTSCGTSQYAGSTGADTITFDAGYTSTITPGAEIAVTSDITIVGGAREINGNNGHRLFTVLSGHLRLDRLTLNNGESSSGWSAGAILVNSGAALTVTNSAFGSNRSAGNGGAIASDGGTLTISNSSFSSNEANGSGGGGAIAIGGGSATITHVTMFNNDAVGVGAKGKALLISSSAARVYLRNSILGDDDSSSNDCGLTNNATLQQNIGNVIEAGDTGCTTASNRRTIGISGTRGSPEAITINENSHANGAGDNAICAANPTDQTGIRRPATACDAGAAERDGFNDIYVDSTCTLPQAIITANDQSTQNQCELGVTDDVAIDVIWLTQDAILGAGSTQIMVDSTMIIEGQSRVITRNTGSDRLFLVRNSANFRLRNVTISGGNPGGDGGAFNVQGGAGIHLENCVIRDNTSTNQTGGGIYFHTNHGTSTIDRCYFFNNRAGTDGGAIYFRAGTLTITNSTFESNNAVNEGGAIEVGGGLATMSHNTVWNNTSNTHNLTTAIHQSGGTLYLHNSIIGRDAAGGGPLCGGSQTGKYSTTGNLSWNDTGVTQSCLGATPSNPNLGARTGTVPYFPLGTGSAAIGLGVDAECALYPTDQAGKSRPATGCDSGAVQSIPAPGQAPRDDVAAGPGEWVKLADGRWIFVREGQSIEEAASVCSGNWLNATTTLRLSASFGLCNGIQFQRLGAGGIGIRGVVENGFLDAVDVWGWARPTVEVCFPQAGKTVFLDAAASPRTASPLASFRDGIFTCARVGRAGTIVLMSPDSPYGHPPAAGLARSLSGCMVRTNYILNLRAEPGGAVLEHLPYDVTLTAFERSPGWYKVDYHGSRGWVSADHVTPIGACA